MESTSIYAALAAVQSELKAPKGQMNTFGGYRYRSCEDILEAVKPILKAHNLLLTLSDEPKVLEGWHYIEATAKLESLDGGCISVKAYAREPEQKTKMDAAQVTGTSSSYARKYALNGLFCIDDTKDADTDEYHAAEGRNPAGVNKPQKQPAPKREAPAPKQQPAQEQPFICACCGKPLQPVTYKGRTVEPAETAASTKNRNADLAAVGAAAAPRIPAPDGETDPKMTGGLNQKGRATARKAADKAKAAPEIAGEAITAAQ